jgi:hypothetical protein
VFGANTCSGDAVPCRHNGKCSNHADSTDETDDPVAANPDPNSTDSTESAYSADPAKGSARSEPITGGQPGGDRALGISATRGWPKTGWANAEADARSYTYPDSTNDSDSKPDSHGSSSIGESRLREVKNDTRNRIGGCKQASNSPSSCESPTGCIQLPSTPCTRCLLSVRLY